MSVLCGVILHPAAHTLSPAIHRAAYRELGLDAQYSVFDVPPERFAEAIRGMRTRGIRQLSVSLPHKEAALRLADRASECARAVGAANTLTLEHDELVADNTDVTGVRCTLEPLAHWRGRRALVLGAGGAARAVVYALVQLGMRVAIANRTLARAERVAKELGAELGALDAPHDLLVNATPVGMAPHCDATPFPAERLAPGAVVFDIVYRPLETRLLREARARGCRTQDGLEMLVHQAIEQIRLWSGSVAEPAALRAAAEEALRESEGG